MGIKKIVKKIFTKKITPTGTTPALTNERVRGERRAPGEWSKAYAAPQFPKGKMKGGIPWGNVRTSPSQELPTTFEVPKGGVEDMPTAEEGDILHTRRGRDMVGTGWDRKSYPHDRRKLNLGRERRKNE
ncbi:MAG: hypothetical protein V1676_06125 [Candidatus Diapherotrites archaeon]